jgi:predicted GNAT superfamily acetyltransferase
MADVDVMVRRAQGLEDYKACVELQKDVWALATSDDMVSQIASVAILKIANEHGGSVLLAEDPSGKVIGFSLAMLGPEIWWSHMTAVVQAHRNRNVGLLLKLRQREEAMRQGINEIHWTFDPLQALNAHFNVHRLGVLVREYEEDVYGTTTSTLHHGLPTDRFIAEWHLDSDRVRDRFETTGAALILRDLDRIPRINSSETDARLDLNDELLLLEIPADIQRVVEPGNWQHMLRQVCRHYFSAGYVVIDFFKLDRPRPQALYLLSHTSALL